MIDDQRQMYRRNVGCPLFWCRDNEVVERTVAAVSGVESTDIFVATLDSDVPAGVSFAKVLPSNYSTYLRAGVPTLSLDQEEHAIIGGVLTFTDRDGSNSSNRGQTLVTTDKPSEVIKGGSQPYDVFFEKEEDHDSGNPSFVIINGQLVLLTCWSYSWTDPADPWYERASGPNAISLSI